jgi:two-component system cell cycle sensor histidine kinase/response regulator CckA
MALQEKYRKVLLPIVRRRPMNHDITESAEACALSEETTELKKTVQELTRREEQLRVLFETSQAGIILVDLAGVITVANSRMAEMFGCTMEELIGSRYPDHVHPEHLGEGDDRMRKLISGEIDHVATERHYIRKDGSDFWGYLSGRRHEDADGNLISLVGHITDVTERMLAEKERLNLEQQLLHAQKLESLGVLAGGIAHDFNNILMAIIGNADLALMRISRESPAVENLQRIENAAAQAADLAKQMLAYSGKGKFVVENIDLNRLLEEMLHMLEVSISKKAILRLNLHRPLPPVEADATQMRQIVMNLVINASEAIGDKSGVIAITTGCMDCDRSYLKGVWLDENLSDGLYVYLEIADTGCGMDKETQSRLFDPFFTTKFTGRGLGMAAVLGIVRGHKGAVRVYSEPGKGTTFKVLLPSSGRPAELFNQDDASKEWRGKGTVLLVDDEETIRGIGAEMLKELGFTTITASDGREAVDIFRSTPDIAFVILDLTMPHMDGEQCFRELRQIKPDVKVIMSSGYNELEVTQLFVGRGLAGFIQKPYRLTKLQEMIQQIIG